MIGLFGKCVKPGGVLNCGVRFGTVVIVGACPVGVLARILSGWSTSDREFIGEVICWLLLGFFGDGICCSASKENWN